MALGLRQAVGFLGWDRTVVFISQLFWLLLLLPGYVVVRRFFREDLECGLLGVAGLSYLAVFGVLSPVSILCYVFEAPLAVFTGFCVIAIAASVVELTRRGWWRELGKLVVLGLSFEALIVLADMVIGARVGALCGGDAVVHLARIRTLLDHGFQNNDPFIAGSFFFPIYHTNLLHALHAACCQLTGADQTTVWFGTLPWGKLMVASGAYYMVWCVFRRRWVAGVAAVFSVAINGPVTYIIYPNQLSPLWIVPMMIGFAVQAGSSTCSWRSPVKLAVGSLVLGQVHSLYGAFAGLALGPVLVAIAIAKFLRRGADRWAVAGCVLALSAALPFLMVSQTKSAATSRTGDLTAGVSGERHRGFHYFDNGWVMSKPRGGWGSLDWRGVCLLGGVTFGLTSRRRREVGVFLAVSCTIALVLFVPPFCTAAMHVFHKPWILQRLGFVLFLGFLGLVPAMVAFAVEPVTRFWWVRSILTVLLGLSALMYRGHRDPFTWSDFLEASKAGRVIRYQKLVSARILADFFKEHVPRGVTVLTPDWSGMALTSLHDCYLVAPERGSVGVPGLGQRREDLKVMLAEDTPWATRRDLLRKYDVRYYLPAQSPTEWATQHGRVAARGDGFRLFEIDTE